MKFKLGIIFVLLLLLSACNPAQTDPEVDCTVTPNHVDCIQEVDCLVTPEHEDCEDDPDPVDCAVTPDHEDCIEEVDCSVTPDHEDCVEEVDCTVTPDHEDCVTEPDECDDNQIEVNEECITLSGPEMQLYNALTVMSTQDNYTIDITIQSPNDMTYNALIAIDGDTSLYQDEGESIYYWSDGGTCMETVLRWNQTTISEVDCLSESSRFYYDFRYDMFDLVSGQFYLQEDSFSVLDSVVSAIDPDASLTSLSMQISEDGIDRFVMTIELDEQSFVITYIFGTYGTTVVTTPEGGDVE